MTYNPYSRKAKEARGKLEVERPKDVEYLVGVAIIRDGVEHTYPGGSHSDIRRTLGDANPYKSTPGDAEGFYTSKGNVVSRWEALSIGIKSGQVKSMSNRELLSSDVNW